MRPLDIHVKIKLTIRYYNSACDALYPIGISGIISARAIKQDALPDFCPGERSFFLLLSYRILTVIINVAKEVYPLFNNLIGTCFNNRHYVV